MHIRRRTLRRLFLILLIESLSAAPALSQNLLVNPGFDRDLSGWTVATTTLPSPSPLPGYVEASLGWTSSDASASALSGGAAMHARASSGSVARAALTQCATVSGGALVTFGAKILTARQYTTARSSVGVSFFASADCTGTSLATATVPSLPDVPPLAESNSGGAWLPATSEAIASATSRSVLFSLAVDATGTSFYGLAYADAVGDDAFLIAAPGALTTTLLPSAGWMRGAGGAYWITSLTLVNPGPADAAVTLKFLPHDGGSSPYEFAFFVRAGQTLSAVEADLRANFDGTYGSVLMTSSSPTVFLQSETSTLLSPGGTVGQALSAFGVANFAGLTPKALAPIRENTFFRTNLVLANPTGIPVTAHVALFAADGTAIGSRDVDLPPLGMTQISRVASALGASTLDVGRIAVSTPTPGGLVAAYASVIDNLTNDPRTLLPHDATVAVASTPARLASNLLTNPGFDRDLSGWTPRILDGTSTQPNANTFVAWDSADAAGSAASGGAGLRARAIEWQGATAAVGQCVAIPSPSLVSFGARFLTRRERLSDVTTTTAFFASGDCTGTSMSRARAPAMPSSITTGSDSGGLWVSNGTQALSPPGARSTFFEVGAKADWTWFYGSGWLDVVADDAFLTLTPTATTSSIVPSAAWISGSGAYWSTRMTLVNSGATDAAVTLKWLGHDADGRGGAERAILVRAGQTMELPEEEWEISHPQNYGAILVTSSSSSLFLQSETSTSVSGGGTVGQALPAFDASSFAGATPKTLAPIRENALFRTNLALANPTEIPVTAHVVLFAADGSAIGSRDVVLPPLGMTQLNRVAAALGASTLDAGRISVSTPTPSGLVAAYASVIDNTTNDPRTLLPR